MNFVQWISLQFDLGLLERGVKKSSRFWPFYQYCPWMKKYSKLGQKSDNEVLLTPIQYLRKAFEANITIDQIGRKMHEYQMGRIGDTGNYSVDNCRFIPRTQNMMERVMNGGSKRQADKIRGVKNPAKGVPHKGTSNKNWRGYFHTPKGRFTTANEAAEANDCAVMTAYDRCHHCDRTISKHATSTWMKLGKDAIGKTYRDLGWWFEEKDDECS